MKYLFAALLFFPLTAYAQYYPYPYNQQQQSNTQTYQQTLDNAAALRNQQEMLEEQRREARQNLPANASPMDYERATVR